MAACEKCWRDASLRALTLGGHVADHYADLLKERKDNPCSPSEQAGEANVSEGEARNRVAHARADAQWGGYPLTWSDEG